MSGHSKWSQIKHKKAATDAKKSQIFSKISRLITIAARKGSDPDANAALRDAISKAKEINMPWDNIERAIKRGAGELTAGGLEEVLFEVFGPGGCAILIEGITDNKNRTLGEIRHILSKHDLQLAGSGSCLWAFEKIIDPASGGASWQSKHTLQISKEDQEKLKALFEEIDNLDDVQDITTNCVFES
jgi:YebC/PmpR family DNA-binding regulatory protein